MAVRCAQRRRNLLDFSFHESRWGKGFRTSLDRELCPHSPSTCAHTPQRKIKIHAHTKSASAPLHSFWSSSQCYSSSSPFPSHDTALALICLNPDTGLSLPTFTFWFYVFRKFITASNSKHKATESVSAQAECTILFFKNISQITSASWICSWNVTLPFMMLFFSFFWSVFEACQDCLGHAAIPIQQMALVLSKHYGNLLCS